MNTRLTLIGVLVLACKRFIRLSSRFDDMGEYSRAAQHVVNISKHEFHNNVKESGRIR